MSTLIWDLDGTLLDSRAINFSIFSSILPEYSLRKPTKEEFDENFHGTLETTLNNLALAQGVELSSAQYQSMETVYLKLQGEAQIYDNPQDALFKDAVWLAEIAKNKGYRQIIVTNRKHDRRGSASPREIVARSSLSHCITDIICGDDAIYNKPDVRVFEALSKKFDPSTSIVIGDQMVDMILAKNIGSKGILIQRESAQVPQSMSDYTSVSSLTEVDLL